MLSATSCERAFLGTALHTPVQGQLEVLRDALIVVAGLPELRSDHAQSAIEMAMAMQCHLETMWAEHPELRLRIGIHTGPVIAGG